MSQIGYYRYKLAATTERTIDFNKNGILAGSKTIKPVEYCSGDRILKYLDSKGQYRFYPFNKYYETNDNPRLIGTTNEFITSILNDNTNSKNIGYKNTRSISLVADVSDNELTYLTDIYSSPRIYLYIGSNNSDTQADWLEVRRTGGNTPVKRRKENTGRIEIVIELPEHFSIKMI